MAGEDVAGRRIVARWEEAERRLYPLALSLPDVYERYLVLVRELADRLSGVPSVADLVRIYEDEAAAAPEGAAAARAATDGLDADLARSAAFALRYREIRALARGAEPAERLRQAAERGEAWVTLYETPAAQALPFGQGGYDRWEMHLSTGRGLHAFVEFDADTLEPVYGLEVLRLSQVDGTPVPEAAPLVGRRTFADRTALQSAIEKIRRDLADGGAVEEPVFAIVEGTTP